MRKKWLTALMAVLILSVGLAACNGEIEYRDRVYNDLIPGTYIAEVEGFVTTMKIATTVSSSHILEVKVLEHKETHGFGNFSVEMMPGRIVAHQSVEVDAVSGSTMTSMAILLAVEEALADRAVNKIVPDRFLVKPPKPDPVNQTLNFDVVVVGAGSAGLTAAIAAQQQLGYDRRRNVLLIDKMDVPGGNTIRSSGSWNSSTTETAVRNRIASGLEGGHRLNNIELMHYMIANGGQIFEWHRTYGLQASSGSVTGDAKGLILNQLTLFKMNGGVVLFRTEATKILMSGTGTSRAAVGIEAKDLNNGGTITINAGAVVLAGGGFGYNYDKYVEVTGGRLAGYVSNNSASATGELTWIAERDAGAALIHIHHVQTHPTVNKTSRFMFTEGIRGSGGLLIAPEGNRFCDETDFRDRVSNFILHNTPNNEAVLLWDSYLNRNNSNVRQYYDMGVVEKFDTLEDLAEYFDLPWDEFEATLNDWNTLAVGVPDEFGRPRSARDVGKGGEAPWYAQWAGPGIHHTMGGIVINPDTQVIAYANNPLPGYPWTATYTPSDEPGGAQYSGPTDTMYGDAPMIAASGTPIPGLFAAGEITGGVHGGNRQGGNALVDTQVFGRAAGHNAARYVDKQGPQSPWKWSVPAGGFDYDTAPNTWGTFPRTAPW